MSHVAFRGRHTMRELDPESGGAVHLPNRTTPTMMSPYSTIMVTLPRRIPGTPHLIRFHVQRAPQGDLRDAGVALEL